MPRLDIDMFDEDPKVGDKVKVLGNVDSIDEESGEVEVTYDDVKIIDPKKRKKRRNRDDDDDDDEFFNERVVVEPQMDPNQQTLDQALAQTFPNTQ